MTRLKNTLTYIGFAFLMFIVLIHSSNALNSIIFYNPSKYQINFEYQITHTKTGQKYSEGVVELPPGENKKIELRQDIQEKTTVRVVRVCFKEGISLKYLETFWYFNKATMQENDSVTFPYKTQENKELGTK